MLTSEEQNPNGMMSSLAILAGEAKILDYTGVSFQGIIMSAQLIEAPADQHSIANSLSKKVSAKLLGS